MAIEVRLRQQACAVNVLIIDTKLLAAFNKREH
jgi:hypothetical protein